MKIYFFWRCSYCLHLFHSFIKIEIREAAKFIRQIVPVAWNKVTFFDTQQFFCHLCHDSSYINKIVFSLILIYKQYATKNCRHIIVCIPVQSTMFFFIKNFIVIAVLVRHSTERNGGSAMTKSN